jgi:hypothetical protein
MLSRLRQRLAPGGRLLLVGEPVVGHPIPVVPFPWGPRLDALSVFCIRHHGWLELGFTQPFLLEALQRSGYRVSVHHFTGCGPRDPPACRFQQGVTLSLQGRYPFHWGTED